MFTGIIQSIGTVHPVSEKGEKKIYTVNPHLKKRWKVGESVNISGVCSTIMSKKGTQFFVEYMPHTLQVTTISHWKDWGKVNIEPSLKVGNELSGHFVLGHIDGIAKITRIQKTKNQYAITCAIPKPFLPYMALKGSIALDGVSLTIGSMKKNSVTVFLTPFTYHHTTFQYNKIGDALNVEADMIAKHIHRQISHRICK
ncbi:riboflavin synthase [Candidatus Uhrbacteria bacterium]|nr:riboflavin synthase [Candidatus Uhrbacteria bacterium]